MIKRRPPYELPREETLWVDPETRKALFLNLLANYPIYCPGMTLQYAYLNYNSKFPADYMLIFSGKTKNREDITLWTIPYCYAFDSIPGYRYAVKNGFQEQFFKYVSFNMCKITTGRFREFIVNFCQLSLQEGESYWQNPEFAEILLDNMSELALRYTPKT